MNYVEFRDKWIGKPINYDTVYGAQCMDVYRQYVKEVLGYPQSPPVPGAKVVWWRYLSKYFVRVSRVPGKNMPERGDIVIWGTGPFGHIAICDSATLESVTCFEQNWKEGDGSGVSELRVHDYYGVLGWLKVKEK